MIEAYIVHNFLHEVLHSLPKCKSKTQSRTPLDTWSASMSCSLSITFILQMRVQYFLQNYIPVSFPVYMLHLILYNCMLSTEEVVSLALHLQCFPWGQIKFSTPLEQQNWSLAWWGHELVSTLDHQVQTTAQLPVNHWKWRAEAAENSLSARHYS